LNRESYVLDEFVHEPRKEIYVLPAASVIVRAEYTRQTPSPGSYCAAFVTEGVRPTVRVAGKVPVRNRIVKSLVTPEGVGGTTSVTVDVPACQRIALTVHGMTDACTAAPTASPPTAVIIHRFIMESPLATLGP
jgi:hypothetical protein